MDIATLIGIIGGIVLVVISMIIAGGVAVIPRYIDPASMLITFGGALMAMIASTSIKNFVGGLKSFTLALKQPEMEMAQMIQKIIELSNVARKEGLLSLEEAAGNIEDDFLKKGILLIVDGTDPELVRAIMETELSCIQDRHSTNIHFWEDFATMGPAWGMIGTLIGLINMLQDMSDPDALGPNMAVALVTTFYGSLLANWFCTPVAQKLKKNDEAEFRMKEIIIEGLLSIQAGENPRVIEEKLKSFLAPGDRTNAASAEGGEA